MPDATTGLRAAAAPFLAWMETAALPLWLGGAPAAAGGFVEGLDDAARPLPQRGRSTLAQARQLYVASHAAVLGWRQGLPAALAAWHLLREEAWSREPAGGWIRASGPDAARDPAVDLYDQAFMLLALGWLARATGAAAPIRWAHRTLDAIEARQRPDGTPGYANGWPAPPGPRLQNPHMHLLEAALALHGLTGEARFGRLARAMAGLFHERLFDPATGTLAEFYGPAWQRLPEPEPGRAIWPGHHCEWAWLLDRAQAGLGLDGRAAAGALLGFVERHAVEPGTGLIRYAVTEAGLPLDPGIRLWPQTEALKAALVLRPGAAPRLLRSLMARHLARRPRGLWVETYGADGRPVPGPVPATSLYHLFVAYAELRRVLAR